MKRIFHMALLVMLAAVGCVKPPIEGRQDPYTPSQVNFTDEDLRRETAINAPIATRDAAGLLHVALQIRAATDKQLYVDYRFTFFDKNGQQDWQTGWTSKTLAPNVFDQITANSLSARAADFRIDIRYAH